MTQTLIGLDYAGVPAIKITKGSINPALEPDENVGSFLYNSKWAADYKIAGIELIPAVGGDTFVPAGSGLSNYTMYRELSYPVGQAAYIRKAHFPGLSYDFPLCDVKTKRTSNGRFVGSIVHEVLTGNIGGTLRSGNWATAGKRWFGWGGEMTVYYNAAAGYLGYGSQVTNFFSQPSGITYEEFYNNLVVWNLPGNSAAILDGTPQVPIDGAHVIEIDSAGMRVAKPGFDLRSISRPTQVAFDTANHPTKIIGAADVYCPAGASFHDIGVTIPPNAVADVHFYQGGTVYYPAEPTGLDVKFGAEYWFEGSLIRFNNQFAACRARFIIYANGTQGGTSGNNDVIKQFTAGGQDVVQILRPGAGANPTFADIVIDSRWPCVQILKEGYIPVGNGALTHTVNFNGSGCFPMVKYMTVHGGGSGGPGETRLVQSWGGRVRMPFTHVCGNYKGGWSGSQAGDSTYCSLTTNQAVFHTFRGQPVRRYYKDSADFNNNVVSYEYDPSPLYGIRYYILGIPA